MAIGGHLFFAKKGGILDDEQHLAEMVSLMGPPPPEILQRSLKTLRYWDRKGHFLPFYLLIYMYTDLTRIQGIGKAPCLYRSNHWRCEHSSRAGFCDEVGWDKLCINSV